MNQGEKIKVSKKLSSGLLIGAAALLMGINLPSCPGQQALQKQVDDLQAKQTQMQSAFSANADKIKNLENEVKDLKALLDKTADVLKTHFDSIQEMQKKVDELGSKGAKGKPAPKKHR